MGDQSNVWRAGFLSGGAGDSVKSLGSGNKGKIGNQNKQTRKTVTSGRIEGVAQFVPGLSWPRGHVALRAPLPSAQPAPGGNPGFALPFLGTCPFPTSLELMDGSPLPFIGFNVIINHPR